MFPRSIMVTMGKKTKKDKSDVIVKPEDIVTDTVMANAGDSEEDLKKSKKKKKKEKKKEMTSDDASAKMEASEATTEQPQESSKGKKKRNADTETPDSENPSPTKKIKQEGGSVVRSAKERMKVVSLLDFTFFQPNFISNYISGRLRFHIILPRSYSYS